MVPPDTDEVRVIVCPASYVAEVGDIVGVPRAELTITSLFTLLVVSGVEAESVRNIQ